MPVHLLRPVFPLSRRTFARHHCLTSNPRYTSTSPRNHTARANPTTKREYKPTERRITAVIVALPILLVTSYVLFERLVMKKEPKRLKPGGDELQEHEVMRDIDVNIGVLGQRVKDVGK